MRAIVVVSVFLGWAALSAGCLDADDLLPEVGDSCDAGARCLDSKTVLSCEAGTFAAFPCRGEKGCSVSGSTVICDLIGNLPGDPCTAASEDRGFCSPTDPEIALICKDGRFEELRCRGGCEVVGTHFFCSPAS